MRIVCRLGVKLREDGIVQNLLLDSRHKHHRAHIMHELSYAHLNRKRLELIGLEVELIDTLLDQLEEEVTLLVARGGLLTRRKLNLYSAHGRTSRTRNDTTLHATYLGRSRQGDECE